LIIGGLVLLYFSTHYLTFVGGVALLALSSALRKPLLHVVIGRIAHHHEISAVTALFYFLQNLGIVSAIFLSTVFPSTRTYLIAIGVSLAIFIIVLPTIMSLTDKTTISSFSENK
jgi:hypothetical protein